MHQAGNDVLPAVCLHPPKALRPIQLALNDIPCAQRRVRRMQDLALNLLNIQHMHVVQNAGIGALPTALGEKCRPVKHHMPVLSGGHTGQNDRLKSGQMAVLVIQFFCHTENLRTASDSPFISLCNRMMHLQQNFIYFIR